MNTTTTTTTAATKRSSTLYMVELAMMIAIILLMSFTPLGYLRTPGLSITLLTIPVAVGAIILGPRAELYVDLLSVQPASIWLSQEVLLSLLHFLTLIHLALLLCVSWHVCWKDGSQDLFSQHYINHRRRNFPITLLHWHARY